MSNIYKNEPAPLWLHIMGGILGAIVVVLVSWLVYEEYQEYRAKQAIQQMHYKAQLSRERQQRMSIEERKRQEYRAQFNSPECQFWRNHYRNNMTEQNLKKLRQYCPSNGNGTLTIE